MKSLRLLQDRTLSSWYLVWWLRGDEVYSNVKKSFLQNELREYVYVKQLKGFKSKEESENVYKLRGAMYGLRQAPKTSYS